MVARVTFLRMIAAYCLATVVCAQKPVRLDYPELLSRLVDVDWLWRRPAAGERCVQFSSFDRSSLAGPGDAAKWYANDDRGKYLRIVERDGVKEHVMVDAVGPGCVARIWSANPSGTLHFDVDGERVWSVDFQALCSGKVDGVPEPLAGVRSKGGNCYLPIPFGKSLVVSCSAGELYYAVDVMKWPDGTTVPSFAPHMLVEHREAVASAVKGGEPRWGSAVSLPHFSDLPGTMQWFQLFIERPAQAVDVVSVLRRSRLRIRSGDEDLVDVPLTDFFGGGPDWRPWRGRWLGISDDDVAYCYFPMPFPRGCAINVATEGDRAGVKFTMGSAFAAAKPASDALLFRASYHLAKATPARPFSDHLVLDAKGQGRFVGCSLLVRNPSRFWWGEGDEKFTVDGEAFPSWFGTGTEDYFGYAWCDPTPFTAPFHAQIECQGPMTFGFTQLHRTHVLDSVPFQQSFRFDLERWHWIETAKVDYATVAYWYGAPGATSGLPPVPAAAERALPRFDGPPLFVADGALEGEALRVVSCSGGKHEVQDLGVFERTFSRDGHRWWRDGKLGDALVLAVPVAAAGRYKVTVAMVQADDFAIVQCSLGGGALGAPFDGYSERVQGSGPRELGIVELPAGDAELRLELIGRNERNKGGMMAGLDYVRLEKLE